MKALKFVLILMVSFGALPLSAQVNSVIDYTYDARGQVKSISENGLTLECYYDAAGNRITRSQVIGIGNKDASHPFLRCYPNPAIDEVRIEFEQAIPGKVEIEVWSVYGKKLMNKVFNTDHPGKQEIRMDLYALETGFYMLRVFGKSWSGTFKLIKVLGNKVSD